MRMRNRLLGTLTLALLLLGMVATTGIADPGPNGNNDKGLCTAYFNGQKKGHEKQQERNGEYPGPFQALQDTAEAASDGEYEGEEAVYWYCAIRDGAPGIGGNPDHNGRWTCAEDEDGDPQCEDNEAPGNGGGNG
jgi:hypothetical protein